MKLSKKRANLKIQKSKITILVLNTRSGLLHDAIFLKKYKIWGASVFWGAKL